MLKLEDFRNGGEFINNVDCYHGKETEVLRAWVLEFVVDPSGKPSYEIGRLIVEIRRGRPPQKIHIRDIPFGTVLVVKEQAL